MRPGQAAPEFSGTGSDADDSTQRFNEAGAGCPGIPLNAAVHTPSKHCCFNEAGAGCPGIQR